MITLLFIIAIVLISIILNKLFDYQIKKAWRKNPKIKLDEYIKNYNDDLKKEIDGEYYLPGKYWTLEVYADDRYWYCCSFNKSVIRFAARLFIKNGYRSCKLYTSNSQTGNLLFDRSHAKRFVKTKYIIYSPEY